MAWSFQDSVNSIGAAVDDPTPGNVFWGVVGAVDAADPLFPEGKIAKGAVKVAKAGARKAGQLFKKGEALVDGYRKSREFVKKAELLKEGKSRTNVYAGSYDEAQALLADIEDNFQMSLQKVPGNRQDLFKPGTYHTDFLKHTNPESPYYGILIGHESVPLNNPHATMPHINIKHPITKNEITIIIDDAAK